tara:strand:+ start:3568 stop:4077 length:510 start_codon:yes stop_codon:yes gene_type:complete
MTYISNKGRGHQWMNDLFEDTMFFANHRAKKYEGSPYYEDIIQESYIGLWTAIESFDYSKNFDFYRWAQWNISSKIRNFLYENKRHRMVVLDSKDFPSDEAHDGFQMRNVFLKQLLKNNYILNKKESRVVFDIFIAEKTLSEVGLEMSISHEGVRKIKNKAILKLKNCI